MSILGPDSSCRRQLEQVLPTSSTSIPFQPDTREFIRNNALYSLLGPAIRRMWKVEDQFYPELLREVGPIQYDVLDDTAHLSNSHI
jgi:hypothetical protein